MERLIIRVPEADLVEWRYVAELSDVKLDDFVTQAVNQFINPPKPQKKTKKEDE